MSELSDYKHYVEAPRIAAYETKIKGLRETLAEQARELDRLRRPPLRVLPTWKRLHARYPAVATVGLLALLLAPPASLVISTVDPPLPVALATLIVGLAGSVTAIFMLAELLDADRAMRVRYKLRTGEDYDAPRIEVTPVGGVNVTGKPNGIYKPGKI